MQAAMYNDHRPPTPAGICLSGDTLRCFQCERPGALEGYLKGALVALCSRCGHGYTGELAEVKKVGMPVRLSLPLALQEDPRLRLKAYRKTHRLRWKALAALLNNTASDLNYTANRLGVAISPSASTGKRYLTRLAKALDDLEFGGADDSACR